jgi:FAD/FMN-containing dehydrogenase
VAGDADFAAVERALRDAALTLDARPPSPASIAAWLAQGAPGARDRWLDPVDQIVAGLEATLHGARGQGLTVRMRPAPRRSVGPDLAALFVGAGERFGRIDRAWLRVHPYGAPRPASAPFAYDRDPPLGEAESALLDRVERSLRALS